MALNSVKAFFSIVNLQLKTDRNNTQDELSFWDELAMCDGYFLFLRQSNHLRCMNRSLILKKIGVGLFVSCFNLANVLLFEETENVLDHENI